MNHAKLITHAREIVYEQLDCEMGEITDDEAESLCTFGDAIRFLSERLGVPAEVAA